MGPPKSKTAHSCPITLNNRYNGVPQAPGTGMAQSLRLSHSSARSRGHPIVAVVQYDWTTVCCFEKTWSVGQSPAQELDVSLRCVLYLLVILKTLKSLGIHFDHGKKHFTTYCDIPHVIFVTFFVFFMIYFSLYCLPIQNSCLSDECAKEYI